MHIILKCFFKIQKTLNPCSIFNHQIYKEERKPGVCQFPWCKYSNMTNFEHNYGSCIHLVVAGNTAVNANGFEIYFGDSFQGWHN